MKFIERLSGQVNSLFYILICLISFPIIITVKHHRKLYNDKIRKILFIATGKIGDAICDTAILKVIKDQSFETNLVCICNEYNSVVFINNRLVDRIIVYDINKVILKPFYFIKIWSYCFFNNFDFLFASSGGAKALYWGILCGIPNIAMSGYPGVKKNITEILLSHIINMRIDIRKNDNRTIKNIELLYKIGFNKTTISKELPITNKSRYYIDKYLLSKKIEIGNYIILAPQSNRPLRNWPKSNYRDLAKKISEQIKIPVIVTGTNDQSKVSKFICNGINNVYDFTGKFNFSEFVALIEKAKLVICGDSTPSHISDAVGTPLIRILGPVAYTAFEPLKTQNISLFANNLNCYPCEYPGHIPEECHTGHHRCTLDISVTEVFNAINMIIKNVNNGEL